MYNGEFRQTLEVIIKHDNHDACLQMATTIKKQCDAWFFNVRYDEHKSARKGPILQRSLLIYQTAYAGDIVIFKEAIRRICFYLGQRYDVKFSDRGTEPVNELRTAMVG